MFPCGEYKRLLGPTYANHVFYIYILNIHTMHIHPYVILYIHYPHYTLHTTNL